jgi:hypothetical protein
VIVEKLTCRLLKEGSQSHLGTYEAYKPLRRLNAKFFLGTEDGCFDIECLNSFMHKSNS